MVLLYNVAIAFYQFLIHVAALVGNNKARLWLKGRKNIFEVIASQVKQNEKRIWIHASSLGEFEQGRPVIEKIKEQHPEIKIALTFFSPSGYEVRKDYKGADYIFYLPIDRKLYVNRFLSLIQPQFVIFIKYEFWHHYIKAVKQKNIPLYLISANFRRNQHFFRWYGFWFRQMLKNFTHIFVQNQQSYDLLRQIGHTQITVAGDTRFDRVSSIAASTKILPEIEKFVGASTCLIAGSTWGQDEELITRYFNENGHGLKLIIAPHEIEEQQIQQLSAKFTCKVLKYSQLKNDQPETANVLIIDNVGMLSSLYKYGKIAYIGGGFGKGIHNILEAATFGLPVLFGPNYQKFHEAVELVALKGAFPVENYDNVKSTLDLLCSQPEQRNVFGTISKDFVQKNLGATDIILQKIFGHSY